MTIGRGGQEKTVHVFDLTCSYAKGMLRECMQLSQTARWISSVHWGVLWEPCSYLRHQISNLRTYLLVHRIVDEEMLFVGHEVVGIDRCIQTPGKAGRSDSRFRDIPAKLHRLALKI